MVRGGADTSYRRPVRPPPGGSDAARASLRAAAQVENGVITATSSQTGARMKIATAPWPQFDQSHPHEKMAGKRRTSAETTPQQTRQAPRGLLASHGASGKRNGAKKRRYMMPPNTSSGVIGMLPVM